MAFDDKGIWKQEDAGVANKIAKLTLDNSDYMKSARTSGMQTANRRGLGNSSMAAKASQGAAIDRAAPIASQEAQQIHQRNLAEHEGGIKTDQLGMQLAAAEREAMANAIRDMSSQRFGAISNTLVNDKIPASVRSAVQRSIDDQYQFSDAGFAVNSGGAYPAAPVTGGGGGGGYYGLGSFQQY